MRKKRIYLTGFDDDEGVVYGQSERTTAFSLRDALRDLKKFSGRNGVLYKLVRIDPDTKASFENENAHLEAENSVLREQNFAMNKRLSGIREAVKEVENTIDIKLIRIDEIRNLIAAVKEGERK